jgi:hyperosmotically inducible protein
MKKLAGAIAIAAIALGVAACNTNDNANTTTNLNTNRAVVVNNNGNSNTAGVANANGNANHRVTREEYEKNKSSYEGQAKSAGSKIGTGAEDLWLWTKTRGELLAADDLRDSTINVDVDNSVVTLKGTVPTAAQKTKAEQVAKAVDGVKSVKDELKVVPNGTANTNTNANNSNTKNTNAKK